jgi:hypothetical protein
VRFPADGRGAAPGVRGFAAPFSYNASSGKALHPLVSCHSQMVLYKNTLLNTRQLAGGMKRGSPKAKGFL